MFDEAHARGALLGLAVGDALGTTYEFTQPAQPPYPTLATGPATDVGGGGPFDLPAGAITDDTQLAVCLARSLVARRGLDLDELGARYVAWMSGAFDVGNQTAAALERIAAGLPAAEAGRATWRAGGHTPAGNGSLMRTAPLAVALAGAAPEVLVDAALAESLITHADPRCALACAAFDVALAAALTRGPLDGAALVAAARDGLALATTRLAAAWADAPALERGAITTAAADLGRDLDAALAADPEIIRAELDLFRGGGFVRVAFRLAFWHAVHTPSWRDALVDVASRGGDADTNAAIAGALLGARDGEAAIPAAWRARVLAADQRGAARWADDHHPRHLLALIAAVREGMLAR
jgi:ADP-ribosylglycohydrolase